MILNFPEKMLILFRIIIIIISRQQIFRLQIKKKTLSPSSIILRIQRLEGNKQCNVNLDEVAHFEPSHQDLRCLQIQLFSSLVLKELSTVYLFQY